MAKLTVNLVVWNGEKYIPHLFDSLRRQTFRDYKINILDNGSSDNTVELIKKELNNFFVQNEFFQNTENLGFAGGHNYLFSKNDSEYVVLLNQDIYLKPDCLEKVIAFLDARPEAGAAAPRLMKWNFASIGGGPDASFTNLVDSLGLRIKRNRQVIDWRSNEIWKPELLSFFPGTRAVNVFGLSGALPAYRTQALRDVADTDGYIFDSLFITYKEDVDLAYRLASAGFKSFVIADAVAYHDRTGVGADEQGDLEAAKNKRTQSHLLKYNSYKNHLMTLYKNEYWQNFLLDFPWIIWYEIRKFAYFLLFDRSVLKGLVEMWKNRHILAEKRRRITAARRVSWKEMRRFWAR